MAVKVIRKFRNLFDVTFGTPADGDVVTYDQATDKLILSAGGGGGGPPSGPAGGVLGGTYPDPTFAEDMATQAELDAHATDTSNVHGITDTTVLATDAEVAAAVAASEAGQVRDGDAAGGVLSGTYPNPGFAVDMATQAELDANAAASVNDGDAAGGVLAGTYPNPSFAVDMATQAELDAHINDASDAHDASAISIVDAANDFTATDVEGALAELQADAETDDAALAAHLADASDAHDASAISVLDTAAVFTATDVEAALLELYNRLPRELAYVEFTAPVSVTSTTEAGANSVVSAGAVTFDGSTRVKIEFYSPIVLAGSTAGSYTILNLWDGSTDLGRIGAVGHSLLVTTVEVPVKAERFLTPSNASHTYSIRAWRVASDGTVSAGSGGTAAQLPGFVRITKA